MSLAIGSESGHHNIQSNVETAQGLKTAKLSQSQQELEAQMALKLIETASLDNVPAPTETAGQNINIKV